MEIKPTKRSLWSKFKSFVIESKRVFKLTKKPSKEEFKIISKVSAVGIGLIGLIGFIINMIAAGIK